MIMKNIEQKEDEQKPNTQEIDVTQLTGSPEATGVSKVAMGQKANTEYADEDVYHTGWIDRLKGKQTEKASCDCEEDDCEHNDMQGDTTAEELNEAYAKLFEGLAGIVGSQTS